MGRGSTSPLNVVFDDYGKFFNTFGLPDSSQDRNRGQFKKLPESTHQYSFKDGSLSFRLVQAGKGVVVDGGK